MIKVSVIIPIYNVENYIEECLRSAMQQTLREIEIICVNDGTPDNSMDIVSRLAKEDSRIVIVNKANGGLSSARNAGMDVAKGEYLYFLDSDDWVDTHMLEELYDEAKQYDLDNIYFDAESVFENKELEVKQKSYRTYYNRQPIYQNVVTGLELLDAMQHEAEYRTSACLQMPRRAFLRDYEIRFVEGILHEDNLFTFQSMIVASKVKHVPRQYYKRRVRENSIVTATPTHRNLYGYWLCFFMMQNMIADMCVPKGLEYGLDFTMRRLKKNVQKTYLAVSLPDREMFMSQISGAERILFQYVIIQQAERERDLIAERKELKAEIKRLKESLRRAKEKSDDMAKSIGLRSERKLRRGVDKTKRLLTLNRPLVSVIIPVHNASRYLRETLDTLVVQTLQPIEIICVDDGSTDDSLAILNEYASKYKQVKAIHQENAGAGPARNNGMAHAKGSYYLFLDADDWFHKNLCKLAYERMIRDKADVCLFEASRLDMQTNEKQKMTWVLKRNLLPKTATFVPTEMAEQLYQLTSGCPWSKMFKASFVKKHQLQFQDTKNANDVLFVRTALAMAGKITVLKENLVTYRFNDGANTQSNKDKAPLEFYKAFRALKESLVARGVYEQYEKTYLNMVLTESLFNINTVRLPETKQLIKDTLCGEGFQFYGIDQHDRDYFYNGNDYDLYQAMMQEYQNH